jgi:hypothetical protein
VIRAWVADDAIALVTSVVSRIAVALRSHSMKNSESGKSDNKGRGLPPNPKKPLKPGDAVRSFRHETPNKHIDTRCYVHLAHDGSAFYFSGMDDYRSLPAAEAFAAVFAPLPGLGGVTYEQIAASWAAVARLSGERPP